MHRPDPCHLFLLLRQRALDPVIVVPYVVRSQMAQESLEHEKVSVTVPN
jgi:hypothetical protein